MNFLKHHFIYTNTFSNVKVYSLTKIIIEVIILYLSKVKPGLNFQSLSLVSSIETFHKF